MINAMFFYQIKKKNLMTTFRMRIIAYVDSLSAACGFLFKAAFTDFRQPCALPLLSSFGLVSLTDTLPVMGKTAITISIDYAGLYL